MPINQGVKHDSLNLPLQYMFGLLVVLANVCRSKASSIVGGNPLSTQWEVERVNRGEES